MAKCSVATIVAGAGESAGQLDAAGGLAVPRLVQPGFPSAGSERTIFDVAKFMFCSKLALGCAVRSDAGFLP